jgi:asparagine synthase (glutamine-hydrolysing)
MQDPVTGNWIVYNGEIYNFRELRKELEAVGVEFKSHSDTEVILSGYRVWGESCLTRLGGMFAFALWDAPRKRLLLARDPMGIKPLY